MNICYDSCFIVIGVTSDYLFYLPLYFSVFFFQNLFKGAELVPPFAASIMANFEHLLWKGVGNILKRSFTDGYGDSE